MVATKKAVKKAKKVTDPTKIRIAELDAAAAEHRKLKAQEQNKALGAKALRILAAQYGMDKADVKAFKFETQKRKK